MPRRLTVAEQIHRLPMNILMCRAFGHDWDDPAPLSAAEALEEGYYIRGVRFRDTCQRCTSVRNRAMTYTGRMILSTLDHVRGYKITGVGNSREPFRKEYLERKGLTPATRGKPRRRPAGRPRLRAVA